MRATDYRGTMETSRRVALASLLGVGSACLFAARSQAKDITFGVIIPDYGGQYYDAMLAGIDSTASKLSMTRKFLGPYKEAEQAVVYVQNAISVGVDGILLATGGGVGQALGPALSRAQRAGVSVVIIGQAVEGANAVILPDLGAVGRLQASLLPKSGGTVIFLTVPGSSWASELERSFAASVDPGRVNIMVEPVGSYSGEEAQARTEAALQKVGNAIAVVAVSDILALGALQAVKGAGKEIEVIGVDATKEGRAAAGNGRFFTIALRPELQGAKAVETLHGLVQSGVCPNGQKPPCPPQTVTPDLVAGGAK